MITLRGLPWRRWYVQYKRYILPSVVATVVILLTITVFIPQVRTGLELQGQLTEEKARLGRLEEKLTDLNRLNRLELKTRVETAEWALPSDKNVGGYLLGARRVANKSGVALLKIEISPGSLEAKTAVEKGVLAQVAVGADSGSLPIAVTVFGNTTSLIAFLNEIQKVVPAMQVLGFSFGQEEGGFQVKLRIAGQYWSTPKTLGTAEKALVNLTAEEERLYSELVSLVGEARSASEAATIEVPVGNQNLIQ